MVQNVRTVKATNPETGKWFSNKGQTEPKKYIKIRASPKKDSQNVSENDGLTLGE